MSEKQMQYECRNAMYFKANDRSGDDIILVNEKIHHPSGEIKNNLRIIKNYQKPIYIHKPAYQKYKQKRVWAPKSEMDVYWTNEARLQDKLKQILGLRMDRYMPLKEIYRNPYIYGADISPTVLVRKKYKDSFPEAISNASVAVLDIETSVTSAKQEIIAIALTFKEKAILVTTKQFLGSYPDPEARFFKRLDELLPEVRHKRKVNVEFVIADDDVDAILRVFKKAHEWQPDYITGWNLMGFDIPKIVDTLENVGIDPAQVFSDPRIEPRFRSYRYVKGQTQKRMSSGKMMPLAGYMQWHWVSTPASFFIIDAMCAFYAIRRGQAMEENYKLDTILEKYIGRGKVGIPEADHLGGVDKHRFMQTQYKIEYLVYNLFDCIGIEMLDEKTGDLSKTFGVTAGVSDFGNYNSNPKRLSDAIFFFVQEDEQFKGVLGTVSDDLKTDLDKFVPSLDGWIVALATERLIENGNCSLRELPHWHTKIHAHSADIDISSSYPNGEITMNISKDTTVHELHRIQGLTLEEQKILGLNMISGRANNLMISTKLYKLPHPTETYKMYKQARTTIH